MTIWFDWSTSWQPLSSFSECLSGGDAMPCLLWAAVMWVRSISVGRLSVWLHSSMLPAGRTRRSPQYRPEHTPPRGITEGQSEAKWTPEKEVRRKGKQRAERGQDRLQSTTILTYRWNILDPLRELVVSLFSCYRKCLMQSLKVVWLQKLLN